MANCVGEFMEAYPDVVVVGASEIYLGNTNYTRWLEVMEARFGEGVRVVGADIYREARKVAEAMVRDVSSEASARAVPETSPTEDSVVQQFRRMEEKVINLSASGGPFTPKEIKKMMSDAYRDAEAIWKKRIGDPLRIREVMEIARGLQETGELVQPEGEIEALFGREASAQAAGRIRGLGEVIVRNLSALDELQRAGKAGSAEYAQIQTETARHLAHLTTMASYFGRGLRFFSRLGIAGGRVAQLVDAWKPYVDALDEYRYGNMLSNVYSHERNIFFNALKAYAIVPADMVISGGLSGGRAIDYYAHLIRAVPRAFSLATDVITGRTPIERPDIAPTGGALSRLLSARIGKSGERIAQAITLPSRLMEAMDVFFSAQIADGLSAVYMRDGMGAEQARARAENDARTALLRADLDPYNQSGQGELFSAIDRTLGKAMLAVRRIPIFGGFILPFVRTTWNFLKDNIARSPIGLARVAAGGTESPNMALAQALQGTALSLVGWALALEGRTAALAPDDEEGRKLFYASGRRQFSVKIGDRWIPMAYFGPYALSLAIPAILRDVARDQPAALVDSFGKAVQRVTEGLLRFMSQQSFLANLDSYFRAISGDIDVSTQKAFAFTSGQLIPFSGFMRWVATVIDPVYRRPGSFVQQIESGIPWLTTSLPFYRDLYGEPATRKDVAVGGVNIPYYLQPYQLGIESEASDKFFLRHRDARQYKRVGYELRKLTKQLAEGQITVSSYERERDAIIERVSRRIEAREQ